MIAHPTIPVKKKSQQHRYRRKKQRRQYQKLGHAQKELIHSEMAQLTELKNQQENDT
jgi:hypothetical protein